MATWAKLFSTGFGIGYSPIAPGTAGSLAVLILYWLAPTISSFHLVLIAFILMMFGIYAATITEKIIQKEIGNQNLHDPRIIVIDEIIGMLIALIAIPKTIPYLIFAFLLFRFFDIVKPFPVRQTEKFSNGWGIVLDDVMAGIYANLTIQLVRVVFHF